MYKYMKAHELLIKESLTNEQGMDKDYFQELAKFHKTQIEFMQHERLIHLMVTIFCAISSILLIGITLITEIMLLNIANLMILIIVIFYIVHYYHLENGVQRWYLLYNELLNKCK